MPWGAPDAPKSEVTTPMCRSAYLCCDAATVKASKNVWNFARSCVCIASIEFESSIMNSRSTLFFGETLMDGLSVTVVGGLATGGS